jgi:hypothetical protein
MAKFKFTDISKLAKKIRNKKPGMKWTSAIKEASRQLKSGKKKVGATLLIEKKETKKTKPKRVVRITRKKNGTFKSVKQVSKIGSARRILGNIPGAPKYDDPIAADDIYIYYRNDGDTYRRARRPTEVYLYKKWKAKNYDVNKAAKIIRRAIEYAMKRYQIEFGSRGDKWHELLSVNDRVLLALSEAQEIKQSLDQGTQDYVYPNG